jgi:hypothetical protein
VVDHNSVALFSRIPDAYLDAAEQMTMLFVDRSVGQNIDEGLSCLSYPSYNEAPNNCRLVNHVVPAFSVDPSVVFWSRAGGYDRSNWVYQFWPDAGCGGWYELAGCFISMAPSLLGQYDVISFQFSYLEVMSDSTIADPSEGFFSPSGDVYDLAAFEAQHPDTIFIYWTTSLARSIGTTEAESFNNQMRAYARSTGRPLFDVADILSHDPYGNPCYDDRDGIPYDNGHNSENYPDDGMAIPAICQHYTTEVNAGHLGAVDTGKLRVAQAFWVLMSRLAGWGGS